uniref:Polyprotein n=1 Tax=Ditylenchus dipsaci TaxID=166011 RepID=A0A915DV80_9BILA
MRLTKWKIHLYLLGRETTADIHIDQNLAMIPGGLTTVLLDIVDTRNKICCKGLSSGKITFDDYFKMFAGEIKTGVRATAVETRNCMILSSITFGATLASLLGIYAHHYMAARFGEMDSKLDIKLEKQSVKVQGSDYDEWSLYARKVQSSLNEKEQLDYRLHPMMAGKMFRLEEFRLEELNYLEPSSSGVCSKAAFDHVKRHQICKLLSRIRMQYKKVSFEFANVDLQSQDAFEIARRGEI